MHSCRRFGVSFQKVSPSWWGRRFRLPGLFLILKRQAKPPAPPKPPSLFVAIDRDAQDRIGAERQNLALSGIVAAQLPDHAPFAVHELTFLHVAEPDRPRP